jgi:parallel beta-helix repeat protein
MPPAQPTILGCPAVEPCTICVAQTGSDSNRGASRDGTCRGRDLANAFLTIGQAASVAAAGSVVCVASGAYYESVNPPSGSAGHFVQFRSVNPAVDSQGQLTGNSAVVTQPTGSSGDSPVFNLGSFDGGSSTNYLDIDGFEISGGGAGVGSEGNHICVRNNYIHDADGDGVGFACSDYHTVYNNVAYNNGRYAAYCGSGLSDYEPIATDTRAGVHIYFSHNISHGNTDAGLSDCGDGNGIIFDDWNDTQDVCGDTPYAEQGLIDENLVYNNGGRGVFVFESCNVTVRNNTAYEDAVGPCQTPRAEFGETIDASTCSTGDTWINNLGVASRAFNSGNLALESNGGNYGDIWDNNLTLCLSSRGKPEVGFSCANMPGKHSGNIPGQKPLLISPTTDFHIAADSPAAGTGTSRFGLSATDQAGETLDSPPDIGAYNY